MSASSALKCAEARRNAREVSFFETLSHGFTEPYRASLAIEGGFCKARQQQLENRQFTKPAVPHQAMPPGGGKAQPNIKLSRG